MSALAIIPAYLRNPQDLAITVQALTSLRATEPDLECLVVDDASPVPALVDELDSQRVGLRFDLHRAEVNAGFSTTVNVGLARALAEGKDAVLVNADVEFIEAGWLGRMERQPREDGTGLASIVGGLLVYPNGTIQHAGIFFSLLHRTFGHRFHHAPSNLPEAQNACVCPVTGALQFIRHECLEAIGLYDPEFTMGYEDVDYGIRAWLSGRESVYQPAVRAVHYESLFRARATPKLEKWQSASWWHFVRKYRSQSFAEFVPSLI